MTHIPHPVTIDPADGSTTHRCPIGGCPWEHLQPAATMWVMDDAGKLHEVHDERERAHRALETHIGRHSALEWAQAIAVVRSDLERARDALRRHENRLRRMYGDD